MINYIFNLIIFLLLRQTQNKEITTLRSKLVEYESDMERLKRQLTNERFERERAAQELRKLSESSELATSRFNRSISPTRTLTHSQSASKLIPLPLPLSSSLSPATTLMPPPSATSSSTSSSSLTTCQNQNSSGSGGATSAASAAVAAAAAAVAASNAA